MFGHRLSSTGPQAGMALAFLAVVFNTAMDTLSKSVADTGSTWQIVFLRWAWAAIILLPIFLTLARGEDLIPWRPLHLYRFALNVVASICFFYALARLDLSIVLTIFFTEPLITMLAAQVLLGEQMGRFRWVAGGLGLVGVIIVAQPQDAGAGLADPVALVALFGAVCWGVMHAVTKKYGAGSSALSMMFWIAASVAIASSPGALLDWQPMPLENHLGMVAVAVCGSLASLFWIRSLKVAPAAVAASVSYLSLPFAYTAGYLFFDEVPSATVYVGSAVVIAAVFMATAPMDRIWRRFRVRTARE